MIYNIVFLLLCTHSVHCLIGYDCNDAKTNITTFDLTSDINCDIDHNEHIMSKSFIKLLQKKSYNDIIIKSCLLTTSSLILHCGMHSHSTMVENGLWIDEIQQISYTDCMNIHNFRKYKTYTGHIFSDININATTHYTHVDVGHIEGTKGNCEGGSITKNGISYHSVTMTTSYKFDIRILKGKIIVEDSTVLVGSGNSFPYHDKSGFDSQYGNMYWQSYDNELSCLSQTYSTLYAGIAYIFTDNTNKRTLVINGTSHALAIGLKSEMILCNHHGFETDHVKLIVLISTSDFSSTKHTIDTISSDNIDMFLYMNSKLVYLEKHFSGQIQQLYINLQNKLCDLSRQVLNNMMSIAMISPIEFAYTYKKKEGYTAFTRGEVVYLLECKPVVVTLRKTDECYTELPISYKNESFYLYPKSRIILPIATQVDCMPLTPTMFNLHGQWYQSSPYPVITNSPNKLSLLTDHPKWNYKSIDDLMNKGIYTYDELRQYQENLIFPLTQPAITNIVSAALGGKDVSVHNLHAHSLFSDDSLNNIKQTVFESIYGTLWKVCIQLGALSGFLMLISILKYVGSTIINGALLYETFGCGFSLCRAFWGTLTKHKLYKHLIRKFDNTQHDIQNVKDISEKGNISSAPLLLSNVNIGGDKQEDNRDNIYPQLDVMYRNEMAKRI